MLQIPPASQSLRGRCTVFLPRPGVAAWAPRSPGLHQFQEQRGHADLLIGNGFSAKGLTGLKLWGGPHAADASRDSLRQR
jgi:hypothetical protein